MVLFVKIRLNITTHQRLKIFVRIPFLKLFEYSRAIWLGLLYAFMIFRLIRYAFVTHKGLIQFCLFSGSSEVRPDLAVLHDDVYNIKTKAPYDVIQMSYYVTFFRFLY